jgi:very-short-patch-repair endonuclease
VDGSRPRVRGRRGPEPWEAANLWRLTPKCPASAHVTVPGDAGRARRKGIVLHRSVTLTARDVTRRGNIPVTTPARTLADMGWGRERTRSDLERKFVRLLREHDLPLPEVNVKVGPFEIDFLWRSHRLAVELDSYAYHSDRATFIADRARDRELRRRGFTVLRFADIELDERPEMIVATVRHYL